MKTTAKSALVVAIVSLILGLGATIILHSAVSRGSGPEVNRKEPHPDPEALFEAGVKAAEEKDLVRADALTQLALREQASRLDAVGSVWGKFRNYLDGQKLPPADRLNRLLVYRESVDAALQACRNPEEFQEVWRTHKQVVATIAETRTALLQKETEKEVEDYRRDHKNKSFSEQLVALNRLWLNLEPKLLTLAATAVGEDDPGAKPPLNQNVGPAVDLLEAARGELAGLEREAEDLAEKSAKEKTIEAAGPDKTGECERLAEKAWKLRKGIEASQLPRWFTLGKQDAEQGRLNGLYGDLSKLHEKLTQVQQLRYNLWAVHQLYTAESATSWEAHLSRIDIGRLHPTVAALYSTVYDSRIKGVDRPQDRVRIVQTILGSKKVQLNAF